jgi:hypothetical protein
VGRAGPSTGPAPGDAPAPGGRAGRIFAAGGSTVAGLAGLATIGLLAGGCSAGGTGMRDEGPAVPAPVERTMPTPSATPAPQRASVDPVSLLRADPNVSPRVKTTLKPCASDSYPVNTSYGDLTGGSVPDIVINVTTCKDSIGIGTYVYRVADGSTASAKAAPSDAKTAAGTAGTGTNTGPAPLGATPGPDASTTPDVDGLAGGGIVVKRGTGRDGTKQQVKLPGNYENVFAAEEPAVYGTIDRGELVVTQQVYTKGDSVAYPSGEDVVTYDWAKSKFTERYRVRNTYSKSDGNDDDLGAPAPTVTANE